MLPTKEILTYWFQCTNETEMNAFWFDTSCDEYIRLHYQQLVDTITYENYKEYITNQDDKIALLLVGDQFTRNIYRDTQFRTKNDKWALELALELIKTEIDLTFPLNYRFFILLPLRHHKTSPLLDMVVQRIKIYMKEFNHPKTLIKFYTQTVKNYTELTDRIVYSQGQSWNPEFTSILEPSEKISNESIVLQGFEPNDIAVSLSGGVDSMVLLHALQCAGKRVVAIHLEYCNRDESKLEREFLEFYCWNHNIPFYYQTIHYIKREDVIDRSVFEEETKKVRFRMYQYVVEKEGLEGVCLGHHLGDIVENVFTNMIKGRNTDIMVMQEKQMMCGVTLFRPFLKQTKDQLFQVAHSKEIPYFLNSTPTWSCRGVLRNTVIPALKKQFGDFEVNMIRFAEQYSSYSTFYEEEMMKKISTIHHPFVSKIKIHPESIHLFPNLLLDFMHKNGYAMVSKKSVSHFMNWYKGSRNKQIQLSKDVFVYEYNTFIYLVNLTKLKKENPSKKQVLELFDHHLPFMLNDLFT